MPPREKLCLPFPVRETTVLNIFQVYKRFQHTWVRLREPQTCLSLSPEPLWFYFMSPCRFSAGPFVLSVYLICILHYQANMFKCFCITKDSFFYSSSRKGCAKTVILSWRAPMETHSPSASAWSAAPRQRTPGKSPPRRGTRWAPRSPVAAKQSKVKNHSAASSCISECSRS